MVSEMSRQSFSFAQFFIRAGNYSGGRRYPQEGSLASACLSAAPGGS
jgi:hypothetical protein